MVRVVDTEPGSRFALEVGFRLDDTNARYRIDVSRGSGGGDGFRVTREELSTGGGEPVYTSHPSWGDALLQGDETQLSLRMAKTGSQRKQGYSIAVPSGQPALTQIREDGLLAKSHKEDVQKVIDALASMRFLDLIPDRMRQPSFPDRRSWAMVARTCRPCCERSAPIQSGERR